MNVSFFVVRLTTPEKSLKKGFTGIAILKTPIPLNENNKNTRNWEINRDLISNGTVVGFQLGLFPLPNDNKKIMIIGVATGILQTFLAQQFPKMVIEGIDIDPNSIELSKKWYGFEENERNQIIIDNAQNYLEGISSKNEKKYKAILSTCRCS
ncbi:unnamed protein product [Caenorhabditis angaria]|uniref:Methyltransferase domain-containing protein n=1 Tax=Caenorhabditis angaria TaxID=860376 RepID=A0A9P1MW96_9PELO|nr:unnamed protein product [Caenorhabditis angaria]